MEPDPVVESFIRHLRELRRAAGNPAWARLSLMGRRSSMTDVEIGKSTLYEHLTGQRRKVPDAEFVAFVYAACLEAAKSLGRGTDRFGQLDEWLDLRQDAEDGGLTVSCPICRFSRGPDLPGQPHAGQDSRGQEPEVAPGVIVSPPEELAQGSDPPIPAPDRPDVIVIPQPRKYRRYHLVASIVVVVVLAVAAGLGVRAWIDRHRPGQQHPPAGTVLPGPHPWEHATIGSVDGSATVAGGVVYIADDNGVVYALAAADGRKLWTYPTHAQIDSRPFVASGVLYVGNDAGNFYAIHTAHGTIDWTRHFGYGIDSSATVVDGIVYFGDNNDYVDAVRAAGGDTVWRHPTAGNVQSSPVVRDGIVYVGCDDDHVYALSARNGNVVWKRKTAGPVDSSPVVADGDLYIGSGGHDLYAFRTGTANGPAAWVRQTAGAITAAPFFYRNVVYVGDANGTLYAFDAQTGRRLHEYVIGGVIDSTPYVYRGIIYVGNWVDQNSGTVYAITTGGRILWRHQTGGEVHSSPVVADGLVYVGTDNDAVLAFRLANG